MAPKLAASTRAYAIQLYADGWSSAAVAERLGIHETTVQGWVKDVGITRSLSDARKLYYARGGRNARTRTDVDTAETIRRFQEGEAVRRIAASVGVDASVIKRILRDAGLRTRAPTEANALVNREKASSLRAQHRMPRFIGKGEDDLYRMLTERGEYPRAQFPAGTRNIDLAVEPVAIEVWLSSSSPLTDPYCRRRLEYLANRRWWLCYVLVSRRTRILLPAAADEVVAFLDFACSVPTPPREHVVIRGCGEVAARFHDGDRPPPLSRPSRSCPHHVTVSRRFRS